MSLTDWNDLHVSVGLNAVREQLLPLLSASAAPVDDTSLHAPADIPAHMDALPPVEAYDVVPADWRTLLMRSDNGALIGNHANAYTILSHDEHWNGVLAYDEFSCQIYKRKYPPYRGSELGPLNDADLGKALVWMQMTWRLPVKQLSVANDILRMVAHDNPMHRVREMLNELPAWDGNPRLWSFLHMAFGAACNEYTSHVGTGWLVTAMARVFEPGCKVDTMLILEGGQGLGKSTAIRELCGAPFYLEIAEAIHSKDFLVAIQGAWFVEIGEMQSFSKAEVTMVKSTITRRDDKFRAPYDRYASSHLRQSIFVGTTNAEMYLADPTGGRRFLPVACRAVDMQYVVENRAQLLAEAIHEYKAGFKWWEFPADKAKEEQDSRYTGDSWEEPVARWLDGAGALNQYPDYLSKGQICKVTTTQILQYALGVELGKHTRQEQLRVGSIMRRLGWKLGKLTRHHGALLRFYERPSEEVQNL